MDRVIERSHYISGSKKSLTIIKRKEVINIYQLYFWTHYRIDTAFTKKFNFWFITQRTQSFVVLICFYFLSFSCLPRSPVQMGEEPIIVMGAILVIVLAVAVGSSFYAYKKREENQELNRRNEELNEAVRLNSENSQKWKLDRQGKSSQL